MSSGSRNQLNRESLAVVEEKGFVVKKALSELIATKYKTAVKNTKPEPRTNQMDSRRVVQQEQPVQHVQQAPVQRVSQRHSQRQQPPQRESVSSYQGVPVERKSNKVRKVQNQIKLN